MPLGIEFDLVWLFGDRVYWKAKIADMTLGEGLLQLLGLLKLYDENP